MEIKEHFYDLRIKSQMQLFSCTKTNHSELPIALTSWSQKNARTLSTGCALDTYSHLLAPLPWQLGLPSLLTRWLNCSKSKRHWHPASSKMTLLTFQDVNRWINCATGTSVLKQNLTWIAVHCIHAFIIALADEWKRLSATILQDACCDFSLLRSS